MTTTSSTGGGSVERQLYDNLTSAEGFSPAQAAGILGNAQVESGFSPTAYNGKEGAIGLFQWEGGRRSALDAFAAAHQLAETDPAAQIGYLDSELAGPYAGVAAQIRQAGDPATAARLWDVGPGGVNSGTGFENSSGSATSQRMSDAQAIYAQLAAGQQLTGGGAGSSAFAATSTSLANIAPGGMLDPLNWPTEIISGVGSAASSAAGSVAGSVLKVVLPFATKAFFVVTGLGVVAMGLYRASKPARQKIEQVAPEVAPLLAGA